MHDINGANAERTADDTYPVDGSNDIGKRVTSEDKDLSLQPLPFQHQKKNITHNSAGQAEPRGRQQARQSAQ